MRRTWRKTGATSGPPIKGMGSLPEDTVANMAKSESGFLQEILMNSAQNWQSGNNSRTDFSSLRPSMFRVSDSNSVDTGSARDSSRLQSFMEQNKDWYASLLEKSGRGRRSSRASGKRATRSGAIARYALCGSAALDCVGATPCGGGSSGLGGSEFWDVIVLTAQDEEQREYYERMLADMATASALCRTIYHVIADTPGSKVGTGGATLGVLAKLKEWYPNVFDTLRVLLVHGGGQSQRLPNHSAGGKLFSPVPLALNGRLCTFFELKLMSLGDIYKRMIPGLFVTCADTIELYESVQCSFLREGFIALAHFSPMELAHDNGVFAFEESAESPCSPPASSHGLDTASCSSKPQPSSSMSSDTSNRSRRKSKAPDWLVDPTIECSQFLCKASEEDLRDAGAIVENGGADYVWIDGSFFISGAVGKSLQQVFVSNRDLLVSCEIDMLDDFLQTLGKDASRKYMNGKAEEENNEEIVQIRTMLWETLHVYNLYCIRLEPSRFYHVATMPELLNYFSRDQVFLREIGGERFVEYKVGVGTRVQNDCSVLRCIIGEHCELCSGSVVENSIIGDRVYIDNDCIVSHAVIPSNTILPRNMFIQTWALSIPLSTSGRTSSPAAVRSETSASGASTLWGPVERSTGAASHVVKYVTHVFSVMDNLRETDVGDGTIFERQFDDVFKYALANRVWPGIPRGKRTLWNAQLYTVHPTPALSVASALHLANAFLTDVSSHAQIDQYFDSRSVRFSINDCLKLKDMHVMGDQCKNITNEL